MKRLYYILFALFLGVSSVSAQSVFLGKTFEYGDVSNPAGVFTYIVDNNGNAILRQRVESAEFQMKGKDLSTKKMLIFKGDENTFEATRVFYNGEAMAYKDVLELAKRVGTERKLRASFDQMKATSAPILSNMVWQITYVTEDEVWTLGSSENKSDSYPCKQNKWKLVK